ncbi:MAG: hypothetical protein COU66_03525 [Candidatus Pacebacteria bacterium CG10_big_fil_rev_8_21_14_0_10_44_11]|nr:MAG: hypothetical protein COU66_03525 [Candidatus Pacebacteria bacterium CG10_big_fil_rev_8_21_14_0_10_44_11]
MLNQFKSRLAQIVSQIEHIIHIQRSVLLLIVLFIAGLIWFVQTSLAQRQLAVVQEQNQNLQAGLEESTTQLASSSAALNELQSADQFQINQQLKQEIDQIQTTYQQSVTEYEDILDLRGEGAKVQNLETQFVQVLALLAKRNVASASAVITELKKNIVTLQTQTKGNPVLSPESLPVVNTPPASGYSRQTVQTELGQFVVDILTADLGSTRVQVETASENDCADNCPVSSLANYVAQSGGFAGINGPYFCPAEYPSCAGKTNSFDTLLMNKNKYYFNSDNNVYSSVPAIIFMNGSARVVGQSQEWGRDTGVDAVIAGQPLLLSAGNITFGGDGDPKKGSRGSRSFIGTKENQVVIGVVRNATVAEVAWVLKTLGLSSALNLDSGGSTAFYVNGKYVVGPGRQTPFGIVLVNK